MVNAIANKEDPEAVDYIDEDGQDETAGEAIISQSQNK